MIYKFKSQSEGNLIMLEVPGDQILKIIGKEPSVQGIITVDQIPEAITALERAINAHDAEKPQTFGKTEQEEADDLDRVSLRARAKPFIELLLYSGRAKNDVVWGV